MYVFVKPTIFWGMYQVREFEMYVSVKPKIFWGCSTLGSLKCMCL